MYRDHKRARRDPNPRLAAERAQPAQRCTGLRSPHEQRAKPLQAAVASTISVCPRRHAASDRPARPRPSSAAAPPDSRTGLPASGTARSRLPCPYGPPGPWSWAHEASWPRVVVRFFPGTGQALPGGLHILRQRCGRCPQDRRSSPVSELNGPLGRTLAPNDDLIAVNGSTAARSGSLPAAGRPRRGAWSVAAPVPCSASRRRPAGMACCSSTAASAPWTCPALTPAMARPPAGAAGPGQR